MKKSKSQSLPLTASDIPTIVDSMRRVFPTRAEMHAAIKGEIDGLEERLNEKIRLLPIKEEFFTRMDKLSAEIQKVRDEQTIHAGDHRQISDRFDRIDKHLGISTAA